MSEGSRSTTPSVPAKRADFLHFHRPSFGQEEKAELIATLDSGWVTTGPRTVEFEKRFAEYRGVKHALGLNSCTAGLHIALLAMGVGPGDEVITSPITFAATGNVIVHCGATPVFVDVQPDTLNLDPEAFRAAITPRTKVVIPVHFAGHPCEMDEIVRIARKHGLMVLEDAAHAVESAYRGRPVGSLGDVAAFSFYATKNITTGEGGMVTTDSDELAAKMGVLRLHGLSRDAWKRYSSDGYQHYEVIEAGFKYNMPDTAAALGLHQLAKVGEFGHARARHTRRYRDRLATVTTSSGAPALEPLAEREYIDHAHHLMVTRVSPDAPLTRDELITVLQERNIGTGVHFRALHLHPFYRERYGFAPGMFPIAEDASERLISLPLFPTMTEEDVDYVTIVLRHLFAGA